MALMLKDLSDGRGRGPARVSTMCLARRLRSRGFRGNYLKTMRECAGLSQRALGQRLYLDATRITRIERDLVPLAGASALILAWARACGFGPWDEGLQRFLIERGNAPWLPDGDAEAVEHIARRAAALALQPCRSDRQLVARRVAALRSQWGTAPDAPAPTPEPALAPVGAGRCR